MMAVLFQSIRDGGGRVERVKLVWRRVWRHVGMEDENSHADQAATTRGRGFTFHLRVALEKGAHDLSDELGVVDTPYGSRSNKGPNSLAAGRRAD